MSDRVAKAHRRLIKVLEYLLYFLLAALVVIVFSNIASRSLLSNSLPWAEELSRFLFVWVTFVGAVLVNDSFSHMRMDILPSIFKGKALAGLNVAIYLVMMAVLALLAVGGLDMVMDNLNYRSPALGVSYGLVNAVVPVACAMMFMQTLVRLVATLRGTGGATQEMAPQ